MMIETYKTEEEMWEKTLFYPDLLDFVKSISGYNRWWFSVCYKQDGGRYSVMFTSYETPEYKNFLLSVSVETTQDGYNFKVVKQVTDLV